MKKVNWDLVLTYVYGIFLIASIIFLGGIGIYELIKVGVQPIEYYLFVLGAISPFFYLYWLFYIVYVESLEDAKRK